MTRLSFLLHFFATSAILAAFLLPLRFWLSLIISGVA
jgi:hypothetical protein